MRASLAHQRYSSAMSTQLHLRIHFVSCTSPSSDTRSLCVCILPKDKSHGSAGHSEVPHGDFRSFGNAAATRKQCSDR